MSEPPMAREDDHSWALGHWMQTYSGRRFYPLSPRAEDVDPEDVAHSLSLLCRYNGHVRRFYSVAEHCVLITRHLAGRGAPLEHQRHGLLHDATEAYVGDMVRPLKHHMPAYRDVEALVWGAVCERFGLSPTAESTAAVKDLDDRIVLDERRALLGVPAGAWDVDGRELLHVPVRGLAPDFAEREYRREMQRLDLA